MNDYQIWGFTYLNCGSKNFNAITGTKEEADEEFNIPCFDGVAYFEACGKYYVARYPKYDELTDKQRTGIKQYCGYEPEKGEYGVIMGALGKIRQVSIKEYYLVIKEYQVTIMDEDNLGF